MKITQADRDLAKTEKPVKKQFSEAKRAALHAMREEERERKIGQERFLAALDLVPKDVPTLTKLLGRLSTDQCDLDRRAAKLAVTIQKWHPTSADDLLCLADLTPQERKMTTEQFEKVLKGFSLPRLKIEQTTQRLCANPNCLRKQKRRNAPALDGSKYCSPICRGAVKANGKRSKLLALPSGTRMDSDDYRV